MPILTDRVAWSVSLSVTAVSPAKMIELIKMPFGLKIWDGPRKHVLDGGSDSPLKGAILRGKRVARCKVQRLTVISCAQQKRLNQSRCHFGCKQRKHVLGGVHTWDIWQILLNYPCAAMM